MMCPMHVLLEGTRLRRFMLVGLALSALLFACAGDDDTSPPADDTSDNGATADNGDADGDADDGGAADGEGSDLRFAMILPGPIQDADYNAIGYEAVQAVGSELGVETAYSEEVPVADAERVAREYIA